MEAGLPFLTSDPKGSQSDSDSGVVKQPRWWSAHQGSSWPYKLGRKFPLSEHSFLICKMGTNSSIGGDSKGSAQDLAIRILLSHQWLVLLF
jgi:hypothetical protein